MGGWHPFFQRTHGLEVLPLVACLLLLVPSLIRGSKAIGNADGTGTNGSFIPACPRNEQVKVMLHETIRNEDFWRNTALQHCCDIVSDGYKIAPALQRCVALNFPVVVANRPV